MTITRRRRLGLMRLDPGQTHTHTLSHNNDEPYGPCVNEQNEAEVLLFQNGIISLRGPSFLGQTKWEGETINGK